MNESYKNWLMGFEPATSCILRRCSSTLAIAAVTIKLLNVVGKRVLNWDEFLNLNHALKPRVTRNISFLSKT